MRILLTANASYDPPRGGPRAATWSAAATGVRRARMPARCGGPNRAGAGAARADSRVAPDWVLVSSEDLGHARCARRTIRSGRVVYLAIRRSSIPSAGELDPARTRPSWWRGRRDRGHRAAHGGLHRARAGPAGHGDPSAIYGAGPFASYGNSSGMDRHDQPRAVKGIDIFLETAERLPEYEFGVVPGWGTTAADRAPWSGCPTSAFCPTCGTSTKCWADARAADPALWYEGFG